MMKTSISLRDPFSEVVRLDPFRDIDDLFGGRRLRSLFRNLPEEPQIRMDVKEDADAYRVKAEVPGVKKEDIHIEIDGNSVSISAEVRRDKEERRGEDTLCSERYYGKESRSFTLRQEVDEGKAEARYQDGVLELVLPKKPGTTVKQVTVK
jgi:HSP20 family protein